MLFFTLFVLLIAPHAAQACVQTHDSVYVKVHYETPGNTDISLTLTNLRLASGTPNEFCSCGITNFTNVFSTILYVAFVDSGTTNPVPGFDVWDQSANAANAWNSVLATNDWSAFVSHVNGNGLNSGNPVELIIRAQLAPGYTYTFVDSTLYYSYLGTDAFDNTNQVLGNMHQDISGFQNPHVFIPEGPGSTYFADLDAQLMVSNTRPKLALAMDIYPNPAKDQIKIALNSPFNQILGIEIYDATGRMQMQLNALNSQQEIMDIQNLNTGIYFVKVKTKQGIQTHKFLKQ